MKKISCLLILILLLVSCAPKPFVVDIQQGKDVYLDCRQISAAIDTAEYHKKEARKDDRFMFRYIFPPTGFIAMYRFNKAEGNAVKRIEYLKSLALQKGCGRNIQQPQIPNPQMMNPQMQYRQRYDYNNRREPIFVPLNRGF